jgi:BirA family biotin operon repressor/biotin-[acetyl-CoA-carboxylase] ligase
MEKLSLISPINNAPVYFKAVTTSTMDDAALLAKKKAVSGTVIMTDFQKKGRGSRGNRNWDSEPGADLLFTLLLKKGRPEEDFRRMPLIAGLSIARALETKFNLKPEIKWPNDVMIDGRKIAGILCLALPEYLSIGIGINCNQLEFAPGVRESRISLAILTDNSIDRQTLLLAVLEELAKNRNLSRWREEVLERLYGRRKKCWLVQGEGKGEKKREGIIRGLGDSGELLFEAAGSGKTEKIISGSYTIL